MPDDETAQADTDAMRVERQAPASTTGRLVFELKADGQDEGQHPFEKHLAIAKRVIVGHVIEGIDGDSAVLP
jgi:hypothetical protein